jgi:hypothetical protein
MEMCPKFSMLINVLELFDPPVKELRPSPVRRVRKPVQGKSESASSAMEMLVNL